MDCGSVMFKMENKHVFFLTSGEAQMPIRILTANI